MSSEAPVDRASFSAPFVAVPRLHARLLAEPDARVAFVACGSGETALALTRSYPRILADGWDPDDAAIAAARREALGAGVDDRVRFEVRDGIDPWPRILYDVVFAARASGRGSDEGAILDALRSITAPDGYVIAPAHLVDLAVGAGFAPEGAVSFDASAVVVLGRATGVRRVTRSNR